MNKICTDINQSQKLIELGIDINTADMYHAPDANVIVAEPYIMKTEDETLIPAYKGAIPAWSLAALLKLMPPYLFEFERGIDLNIYPNLNSKGWHCSYMPNNIEDMKKDKFRQITNGDNPVDAAFEMVVWLKENGKV